MLEPLLGDDRQPLAPRQRPQRRLRVPGNLRVLGLQLGQRLGNDAVLVGHEDSLPQEDGPGGRDDVPVIVPFLVPLAR